MIMSEEKERYPGELFILLTHERQTWTNMGKAMAERGRKVDLRCVRDE